MPGTSEIQAGIATLTELATKWSAILNGTALETVETDNGDLPTLAKLISDLSTQITTGFEAGFVVVVADAAARASATPAQAFQLLIQGDTKALYYAPNTTTGSWTIHPLMATLTDAAAISALTTTVNGKMASATYDPSGQGFSKSSINVQAFTTPGVQSYVYPAGVIEFVEVLLVGAGGGGGSGKGSANGLARGGGGGGGAGAVVRLVISGSDFETLRTLGVNVTVGSGGAGGAAVTNANGNPGTSGGPTTLDFTGTGIMYSAAGGLFGAGGLVSAGGAGGAAVANSCGTAPNFGLSSSAGGAGSLVAATALTELVNFLPTGGGGGGGVNSSNATFAGAAGGETGGIVLSFTLAKYGAGGITAGDDGGDAQVVSFIGHGGGGGAGGGGNGGLGAARGGGGGGGGGSVGGITFNSGAGGAGGNGYALLITHRRHT